MKAGPKILLMIDDAPLREPLERELTRRHYQLSSPKGDTMREILDEVPNLIILDEDFRQGDGRALAMNIKEDVILKYIPVILLVKNKDLVFTGHGAPVDFYVQKDEDIGRLLLCVHEAITQRVNELDLNPLTHLPGMRSSVVHIERTLRSKKSYAVCYTDLLDLEPFNKAYGDARGDAILVKLAHALEKAIRSHGSPDDFLGHLGGDDFIILTRPEHATAIAESVIRQFDEAIGGFYDSGDRKKGHLLQRNKEGALTQYPIMSVSVAIVADSDSHRREITDIGRVAGELKKYMKTLEGSCYIEYRFTAGGDGGNHDGALEACFPTRMKSVKITGFGSAVDRYAVFHNGILRDKQIRTMYQPILELESRQVIGYEALTRGMAEHLKNESALLFSLARESGRVIELDKLCVDFALKSAQGLKPDKKLFLNLNHETLIDPTAMKTLFEEKGPIGYKNIVIEVTEQSILRSFEKIKRALHELKEQGVSVAIDDVGGGAVSLRDVAILKPDYIKFDRSLIRQIDSNVTKQQIVLSMILFARGIRALTTAEGIETKGEYEAVLKCGVDLGQGYYFARPGAPFPHIHSK